MLSLATVVIPSFRNMLNLSKLFTLGHFLIVPCGLALPLGT